MRLMLLILCSAALSACASASQGKLPVCDGKHRRPANPYGSVLLPKDEAAPATPKMPDKLSALPTRQEGCA